MKRWIKKHPRETAIGTVVLLGHLFFFFYDFRSSPPPPLPKQSIVVHTHTLPKPKPRPKPKTQKKKEAPPKQPPRKSSRQKALKELEETLAKIEKKALSTETVKPLLLPKEIETLHIDHVIEDNLPKEELSYLTVLVTALQEKLQLPEDGTVRLQITLLKSGRVEKVTILYAESENNKHYLERELIHVSLPPFSDELAGKTAHTFTLNFCHEN